MAVFLFVSIIIALCAVAAILVVAPKPRQALPRPAAGKGSEMGSESLGRGIKASW
jgi:hypothetical protein